MSKNVKRLSLSLVVLTLVLFLIQSLVLSLATVPNASAKPVDAQVDTLAAATERLKQATGGTAEITINRATAVASFARWKAGSLALATEEAAPEDQAMAFFDEYGTIFGITDARQQLNLIGAKRDKLGMVHLTFRQVYEGVDVFAGIIRVHFNAANQMTAVNGVFIPDVSLNVTPTLSADEAAVIARNLVNAKPEASSSLEAVAGAQSTVPAAVVSNKLYVYRDGLLKGVTGSNYLVYEVEVNNGLDVREFVYVDAHRGVVINRIDGIHEGLHRRVYVESFDPASLVWEEGDPFPYSGSTVTETVGVNNLITATGQAYNFFFNTFGYDTWNNVPTTTMDAVWNDPSINCPNANWNGTTINFCEGTTTDDVIAHEWGHAYTQSTSDLIYQWQSGALNESYSDIWGETVDLINNTGLDNPDGPRSDGSCSVFTPAVPRLVVNDGPVAGTYPAGTANFGPSLGDTGPVTADLVLANDGTAAPTEACSPLVNDATGKIVLARRGTCNFTVKVKNAQDAGAIGVIVANHAVGGDVVQTMGGDDPTITIPSIFVGYTVGNELQSELEDGATVNVTLSGEPGSDNTYRWLIGEESTAFDGAIRDMWNPNCLSDPAKVTDPAFYVCSTDDGGGVHTNSAVPNHAYALMVDGGTFNGHTVPAIGLLKAAHIHWQAQFAYHTPSSNFVDHADFLEQACTDLLGEDLTDFDGNPSGEMITAADCAAVSEAIEAVELRTEPAFCGFEPLLDAPAPPVCADAAEVAIFSEDFQVEPAGWTLSNMGVFTEYESLDWQYVTTLPDGREGGYFGPDDPNVGNCIPGSDDQSGVRFLDSPGITVPEADPGEALILTFEHYVATELGWDGGNVWISVNGGGWQLIPPDRFYFNPYNLILQSVAAGNTNPLAGMPAFSGTDEGTVEGSWGESQVDVSGYASPGDTVSVRFALGVDGCNGVSGWYLDSVSVYSCVSASEPSLNLTVDGSDTDLQIMTTLLANQFERHTLEIRNEGLEDLVWTLDEEPVASGRAPEEDAASEEPGARRRDADAVRELSQSGATRAQAIFAVNAVQDGSFEQGSPNPFWEEYVLPDSGAPFGPICNTALCGASFAHSGDGHLWFGGFGPGINHSTGVTQTVEIYNSGDAQLSFWLWMPDSSGAQDVISVLLDDTPVFTVAGPANGPYAGGYAQVTVDVSSYADGGNHVLDIRAFAADGASIFLDDVELNDNRPCSTLSDVPWLAALRTSGTTPQNTTTTVPVIVDSTGLASGVYTANLCLNSNDPVSPVTVIPVTMEVARSIYMPILFYSSGE